MSLTTQEPCLVKYPPKFRLVYINMIMTYAPCLQVAEIISRTTTQSLQTTGELKLIQFDLIAYRYDLFL